MYNFDPINYDLGSVITATTTVGGGDKGDIEHDSGVRLLDDGGSSKTYYTLNCTLSIERSYPSSTANSIIDTDRTSLLALLTPTTLTPRLLIYITSNGAASITKTSAVTSISFSGLKVTTSISSNQPVSAPITTPNQPVSAPISTPVSIPGTPTGPPIVGAPSSLPTVAAFNFAEYYLILILNGLATPTLDTQSQLSLIQAVATVGKISPNYISYYQSNIVIHCIISFTLRISGHGRMLRESRSLLAPISGTYSLNATLLIRRPYSKGVASSVMQTDHDNLLLLLTTSAVLSELTSAATSNNAIAITQDVAISSIGSSAVTFSTPSDSPVASPPTGDNTIQPTNLKVVIGAAVGGTLGFLMLAGMVYYFYSMKRVETNEETQIMIESK